MTQVQIAAAKLFGPGGLGVTNIGISRGSASNVTAEQIAREINRAIAQIESGDFEEVKLDVDG
jgi:type IV pilus biogenesis protein CpaD/CtpE